MVKNMNGLSRDLIVHPGETLKELLEDREMSQRELALRTDVTEKHVSNIVNCQKPISVNFAKKLEYALGIDASFWINLQSNYDKELADIEEINGVSTDELDILKRLKSIVKYLKEIGLLEKETNPSILVINLRKVLKVSSLLRIPYITQAGYYRASTSTEVDPYVIFTWLRMCDLINSSDQIDKELDIKELKKKLPSIKELMFEDVDNIQSKLKTYFAECGIRFSIVKHFKGAPVQGIIKKDDDGTLSLIMTVRYKFADIFWFTLFHEIGHIINDDIKEKLIDYDFTKNDIEVRANEFAKNALIDSEKYKQFIKKGDFSLISINQFSCENEIPNYILIGRLQKDELLNYNQYSSEKIRYVLEENKKIAI
jgi:HTH-type transcriptional regulator / antitoxin HigA